jgi:hypothetical protein
LSLLRYRKSSALLLVIVLGIGLGSYYKLSSSSVAAFPQAAVPEVTQMPTVPPSATASASPSSSPKAKKKKAKKKPAASGSAAGTNTVSAEWLTGVSYPEYDPYSSQDADATAAFGTWRGRTTTVAVTWPNRNVWSDFTQVNAMYQEWAAQPYTKVFGIPPWPDSGGDITDCINGSYDSDWQQFAETMNSTGLAREGTIIRLGWEFNLATDWGTPTQFAECWRQIVSTVSAIAPGLLWDWNVNRGSGSGMPGSSVLQAYPGNAYVNIIGVDSYDDWPDALTSTGWEQQLNGAYGLNYWLRFAEENGKKFSVPEWADVPTNEFPGESGGDDTAYIKDMYDFFSANRSEIAFESYYCDTDYCIDNPDQYPQSAAEYQSLWGGGG